MKKHKLLAAIIFCLFGNHIFAQSSETVRKYIADYKDIAIAEEIRTGVPAAITLAQGIHETGAGTSDLVLSSNNHFGIKCKTGWTGPSVYHDDDAKGECFRKYNCSLDSYKDHSDFLKSRPYYASLFKLDPTDYKGWAYGLKKAGYATNPKYPEILIKLIEDYQLEDYTLAALNGQDPAASKPVWASNVNDVGEGSALKEPAAETTVAKLNYPSGVFKINETKVLVVLKGTSLLKVAEDNHLSLSRLYDFNDMNTGDIAVKDELIYLQRKRKTGLNEFHIVASGETMHDIAQIEAIRFESLLEYNYLKADMRPATGEKLYLRSKAPAMPNLFITEANSTGLNETKAIQSSSNTLTADDFLVYIVQPKETVYAIAKKYAVSIDDLMRWNELQTVDLKTGQQLRINKKSANATN